MKFSASVDYLEGEYATLMVEGKKIQFPTKLLPENIESGNWVDICIEENKEKEIEVSENVENLLDELKNNQHLDKNSQE